MDTTYLRWLVWAAAAYVAVRCLVALAISLRDRLHQLLTDHVRNEQIERKKRNYIMNMRLMMRERKAKKAEAESRLQAEMEERARAA